MTLVSPAQASPGEEITAAKINTPVNQLASTVNGGLNDDNISGLSGTKITAGTLSASAMNTATNVETRFDETLNDFVVSGCDWSATSGLDATMTAGVVYISGKRAVVSSIATRTFTASKDTYVSVTSAGVVEYSEVANGASQPTLPANSAWLACIVTSAVAVTAVDEMGITSGVSNVLARRRIGIAGDTISVAGLPNRKYLRLIINARTSGGTINTRLRFNGDSGANYSYRLSSNGGADTTATGQTNIPLAGSAISSKYIVVEILNISGLPKFLVSTSYLNGTPPDRREMAANHSTTSVISSITVYNDDSGDFAAESEIIVTGHN